MISQFDLASAALEHLELLNQPDQNPLAIAAQFRTLLRSKKDNQTASPPPPKPNQLSYPVINWKYLRRKQYEYKLEQFISMKFKPKIQTPSIRTPCISPIDFRQRTYTISRFNSTSTNDDYVLFPIADCNVIIKHKPKEFFSLKI
jgi:hypothetical protein